MVVWPVHVSVYSIVNAKGDCDRFEDEAFEAHQEQIAETPKRSKSCSSDKWGCGWDLFFICVEWMNPIWCIGLWMLSSGWWKSWKWLSIVWVFMVVRQLFTFLHSSITANTLFLLVKFLVVTRADFFCHLLVCCSVIELFWPKLFKVKSRSKISAFFAKIGIIYKT